MAAATFHSSLSALLTYFRLTMHFPFFLTCLFFTLITASSTGPKNLSFPSSRIADTIITARDADINTTCRRLRTLTKLNDIANNQTALDATKLRGKVAQARIDWIKNNSADITAKLDELTSNSTLTAECDTINAQRDAARECKALEILERLIDSTNGQTDLNQGPAADFLNDEQKQKLQQKFERALLKLQELKSNATLMGSCNSNAMLQQNGIIGSQVVDNSGAIGMTKSVASSHVRDIGGVFSLMLLVVSTVVLTF